ncbi:MAG TPA: hypothetical protein VNJ05_03090 [Sphingomicrobium sp.]|nr:hypothetical protein [Sphingomicrobium sp.]
MSSKPFEEAVDRVERALLRIERAVERGAAAQGTGQDGGRDERLRAKVAAALGELDEIIREAEAHG